jgi:hypothetical protein
VHQLAAQRAGIALLLPGQGGGELVGEVGQPGFGGSRLPGADAPGPGGDGFGQAACGDVVGEPGCRSRRVSGERLEKGLDAAKCGQPGSHPGQRVHHGRRGQVGFDLDGSALEGLPSAAVAGRDGLGAGDAVPGQVAAGRLERGDPLAGDEGPVDPGHPQRPAIGDQQVQVE